jgi:transposase
MRLCKNSLIPFKIPASSDAGIFCMRHIQGESRHQSTLFPDRLEDYVTEDNPVRVIDAYIDTLDLAQLGFTYAEPKETGRRPYNPGDLLKLYVYGYLNRIRSTRRLEKECHRNVELHWLMKCLRPDFKTIANFRQQNSLAIRSASSAFIRFCREANLLDGRLVAIDGSKFKAAASLGKTYNRQQLAALQKQLDRQIAGYLQVLARSEEDEQAEEEQGSVQQALEQLRRRHQKLGEAEKHMVATEASQCCETEPQARRMRSGREGIVAGYNIQTAVDCGSGLIVHHEVSTEGNDNRQLAPMALATQKVLEAEKLSVVADAGYSNGEQLAHCEEAGIEASVPVNRAVNNQGDHYQRRDTDLSDP